VNNLILWNDGVIAKFTEQIYAYFNARGDSVYKVNPDVSLININSINQKEGIRHTVTTSKTVEFSRQNIETGDVLWNSKSGIFEASPESFREDGIHVIKKDDIWEYTLSYTLYSGTKKNVQFLLNTNTGVIK
jgi:hypothetical protein